MGERERTTTHVDEHLRRVMERGAELVATDDELRRFEAQQIEHDRLQRIETSGISERLDEAGVHAIVHDRAKSTRALELVRAWVVSSRPVLVLLSRSPGLGKTVSAAWALARFNGRYVRAHDLCVMRDERAQRQRYYQHLRAELLVIDELGLERNETDAKDMLLDVVDARQRLPRRTLLLGNLDKAAFVARYDARTLSRLGIDSDHAGIALIRSLKGDDLRKVSPPSTQA